MKPDDFKFQLLEHASALRHSVLAQSVSRVPLDDKTSMWLITADAWREFCRSEDILLGYAKIDPQHNRNELLGLPVRLTHSDPEGTPPIQLVMEPMVMARR